MKGICLYESLVNGALNLEDVALMNDALDVIEENREIARKMQNER
jgi:hypothetical protein